MRTGLGEYLSSRRARVTPGRAGLPTTGMRRVPGLRREEVALLAGTSVDYYIRLEQGRERNPSAQVLDALAAALRLDDDERSHLFDLAGVTARSRATAGAGDRVDPSLLQLLDGWPDNPALVHNRAYDVLAANEIADALFDGWAFSRNLMEIAFADPAARRFYVDWDEIAHNSTAGFRIAHGHSPDDPRIRAVLAGLLESGAFRDLWARHDARGKALDRKRFHHPDVGELTLTMQTFGVQSAPGQELVVYHAAPGSPSAEALRLLGSLAASGREGRSGSPELADAPPLHLD